MGWGWVGGGVWAYALAQRNGCIVRIGGVAGEEGRGVGGSHETLHYVKRGDATCGRQLHQPLERAGTDTHTHTHIHNNVNKVNEVDKVNKVDKRDPFERSAGHCDIF